MIVAAPLFVNDKNVAALVDIPIAVALNVPVCMFKPVRGAPPPTTPANCVPPVVVVLK